MIRRLRLDTFELAVAVALGLIEFAFLGFLLHLAVAALAWLTAA